MGCLTPPLSPWPFEWAREAFIQADTRLGDLAGRFPLLG